MRTTVDLDPAILADLKARSRAEGKSLGVLVSELLAPVLATPPAPRPDFVWTTRALGARIDLDDKDAVQRILDSA